MTTFLGTHSDVDAHLEALRGQGHDVRVVRSGLDKAEVLAAFAAALDLPEWFGNNWDALVDVLRELEGTEGRPLEIVWDRVRSLREDDPETYATVLDILEQVADERDDLRITVIAR
jgi:RNAse (barnase) inhibitor barstar